MILLICQIVSLVLIVGLTLYLHVSSKKFDDLEDEYFVLTDKYFDTCKLIDNLRKENKLLQEENDRLNTLPKTEKISKPKKTTTTRKTTTRKTTKK